MPKRGRKRKKNRTHVVENENNAASALTTAEESKVPKTLVIRRGRCEAEVGELVRNLRTMMMPYTALHFQDDAATHQHATLSRYVKHLALPMGITHMLAFSQSTSKKQQPQPQQLPQPSTNEKEESDAIPPNVVTTTTSHLNLRLVKTPQGPTLWFRVHQFSLNRHVQAIQKRPYQLSAELNQHPPIVVTNNFGAAGAAADNNNSKDTPPHVKLMRITFQNMFPAINVATVSLSSCRRVVLFHMIEEDDENDIDDNDDEAVGGSKRKRQLVQVRHYAIKTSTSKAVQNRRVQRLLHPSKTFPNLHNVEDIADYIVGQSHRGGGSIASDSEASDDEDQVEVILPKGGTTTAAASRKSSQDTASTSSSTKTGASSSRSATLKLVELGPRMTLELIKVEKGLESNNSVVLYHAHIHKRPEEVQALQQRHEKQMLMKRQRQAIQQANVERKKAKQQEQQEALKDKKKKQKQESNGGGDDEEQEDGDVDFDDEEGEAEIEMEGDDDEEGDDDDDDEDAE